MRPNTGAAFGSRESDIAGHAFPTWQQVVARDYHAWDRDRLVVDTAASDVTAGVRAIVARLSACMTRDPDHA